MIRIKICALLAAVAMAWSLEAASAGNSLVQVSTSCADVLSLKCIGKDFHLLVTNAHVTATVSVTAVNPPYLLVLPESGECTVSLGSPATYKVKKQQSKEEEKDREPEASGKIIMFRPDFDVRSDAPDSIAATGVNELTDNFTATVNVVPNGIATLNGHSPEMTVVAVEKGTKINHDNNFNISVSVDEDSNLWPTSKTLWYGIEDGFTGCCHDNRFCYEFCLRVDGVCCMTRRYSVGWPNNKPTFIEPPINTEYTICYGYLVEECMGHPKGNYRAELLVSDYPKGQGTFRGLPDLSQYAAETQKEEYFHQKQWLGLVGIEKGGMQDLFTAQGARFFFGHVASIDDGYVYGDDEEEVRNKSALAMQFVNEFEFMTSNSIYDGYARRQFREYHAKAFAGYNAAWKYHCTYGNGLEREPRNEVHPAFR